MKYQQYVFNCKSNVQEILISLLDNDGFEGFQELPDKLLAYTSEAIISDFTLNYLKGNNIDYTFNSVTDTNWNAVWESNFDPITVDDRCFVGANHHNFPAGFEYTIKIQPKMSFGTGHHPTTWLILKQMLDDGIIYKNILDFGTGTGILAILAKMMGGSNIDAIDNDPNCVENCKENFTINKVSEFNLLLGDKTNIPNKQYNLILANVTRNVITDAWSVLCNRIATNGTMLCSGFYEKDVKHFEQLCQNSNIIVEHVASKEQWAMIKFVKTE